MVENEIKELLDEELKSELLAMASMDAGSKELEAATENFAKLYKLKIEEAKAEKELSNDDELALKRAQLKEQAKDRYFRLGFDAASLILPMIFYAIWMHRGFKFEETGTFTSTTFRGLFSRFKPTKN